MEIHPRRCDAPLLQQGEANRLNCRRSGNKKVAMLPREARKATNNTVFSEPRSNGEIPKSIEATRVFSSVIFITDSRAKPQKMKETSNDSPSPSFWVKSVFVRSELFAARVGGDEFAAFFLHFL